MIDHDTTIIATSGKVMTPIVLDGQRSKCREAIERWCDEHLEGDWVITPTYMFFEHAEEATLFKLGFE